MTNVASISVLEWATFAAASVTAIAAGIAVAFTAKTDRRGVDQQRREQASKVGVWVEHATYDTTTDPPEYSNFEVVVYNGSEAPIHDVRLDRLPIAWTRHSEYVEAASVSVVLPGTEAPWIPFAGFEGDVAVVNGIPESPPLRLYFTDNAAVRWVRYPDGRLDEVKGTSVRTRSGRSWASRLSSSVSSGGPNDAVRRARATGPRRRSAWPPSPRR